MQQFCLVFDRLYFFMFGRQNAAVKYVTREVKRGLVKWRQKKKERESLSLLRSLHACQILLLSFIDLDNRRKDDLSNFSSLLF